MKKLVFVFAAVLWIAGCGGANDQDTQNDERDKQNRTAEESQVSLKLDELDVTVPDEQIVVTGKAKATGGEFFYVLKYGDDVVVDETKVTVDEDSGEWGDFSIKLEQPADIEKGDEVPIFTFYVKNGEGEQINPNYVPVDMDLDK